jgi:hypothetical protein
MPYTLVDKYKSETFFTRDNRLNASLQPIWNLGSSRWGQVDPSSRFLLFYCFSSLSLPNSCYSGASRAGSSLSMAPNATAVVESLLSAVPDGRNIFAILETLYLAIFPS